MDITRDPEYDLLILTDATASMGDYLTALNESLPKIIAVSSLTDSFARIGVLVYRDHCNGELTEWSSWCGPGGNTTRDELIVFTARLLPRYGGDWPEATKTALARAYSIMRAESKTVILLYTDAPPHMPWNKELNRHREQEFLAMGGYGPSSAMFIDWVRGVDLMRTGEKWAQVFSIVGSDLVDTLIPYTYMCARTLGSCFEVKDPNSDLISSLTMSILLSWLGTNKPGIAQALDAQLLEHKDISQIASLVDENDHRAAKNFLQVDDRHFEEVARANIDKRQINGLDLSNAVQARSPPVQDFAKRYATDEQYRQVVVHHLTKIIDEDVSSIAINPVFGSLWRSVCNDRKSDARDALVTKFGSSIECISNVSQRLKMKEWLAELYNHEAEIAEIIEEVPHEYRFPCVLLDPTENWFTTLDGEVVVGEDKVPRASTFTRDELLEIGRSCDYRVLRRLGQALTQLTYIASELELPAHLKAITEQKNYNRSFWKILLHLIVPGTKLAGRPAALLAALSIRMGIKLLQSAADSMMLAWKRRWNDLDIPETWNARYFMKRFLSPSDRFLFQRLVDIAMMKANMSTTLVARIGWKPEKTKVSMGPCVICRECNYPRSVTMMAAGGTCGLCSYSSSLPLNQRRGFEKVIYRNVSKNNSETTEGARFECNVSTCRLQYVVYDFHTLNVRPKCQFCREQSANELKRGNSGKISSTAPWLECIQCLNRMIWPKEYRHPDIDFSNFICPACSSGHITIVDIETSAKELSRENGTGWLLRNDDHKIPDPFTLAAKVEVLPGTGDTALKLTLRGKSVRNAPDLKITLARWIQSRRVESGQCSLYFSSYKKRELSSACGRIGCKQPICYSCRGGWYGMNQPGRINIAALSCPFCRRRAAAAAVPRTISGITSLRDLRGAVEESEYWVHAWCESCDTAKRFMERMCAQGHPPPLRNWECDDCKKGNFLEEETRPCPGCGCAVPTCGVHWCYFCSEMFVNYGQIYEHITTEHGGAYEAEAEARGDDEGDIWDMEWE
ncbi:hypothetical protein F5Y15DRAFT_410212 [Xylariaceae sp. FL0016]|nr:hypothetical protein F5Y15DRAFT_410212 [Xylariaceae sp. FL0016]